jgi:hypothetical protein
VVRSREGVYSLFYATFGPDSRHPLPNRGEHVTQGDDAMRRLTVWQKP